MGLWEPGARRFLAPRLVPRQSPWDLITNVCCAHRVDRGGGRAVCLPPRTHWVHWAKGEIWTEGTGPTVPSVTDEALGPPHVDSELGSHVSLASLEKLCTFRKMWLRMSKLWSLVCRTSSRTRNEKYEGQGITPLVSTRGMLSNSLHLSWDRSWQMGAGEVAPHTGWEHRLWHLWPQPLQGIGWGTWQQRQPWEGGSQVCPQLPGFLGPKCFPREQREISWSIGKCCAFPCSCVSISSRPSRAVQGACLRMTRTFQQHDKVEKMVFTRTVFGGCCVCSEGTF